MSIKILIADDHPLIADGIKNTFINQEDFHAVGVVENGKDALDFIRESEIDVVLLDINMPEMEGIQCAKLILKNFPKVKIAMLSMHQEASIIKELITIGVHGCMLKTIPAEELLVAVKRIHVGKKYFTSDVTQAILNDNDSASSFLPLSKKSPLMEKLTDREKEIIKMLTQGMTNAQIGEQLFISPRTVDTHRTNIMRKIEVNNVASLIRFAFQNGLT